MDLEKIKGLRKKKRKKKKNLFLIGIMISNIWTFFGFVLVFSNGSNLN
jgi:hypothetical protein